MRYSLEQRAQTYDVDGKAIIVYDTEWASKDQTEVGDDDKAKSGRLVLRSNLVIEPKDDPARTVKVRVWFGNGSVVEDHDVGPGSVALVVPADGACSVGALDGSQVRAAVHERVVVFP